MKKLTDKQKLVIAVNALKSIASWHRDNADTIPFWMKLPIGSLCDTLATDTDIARRTLEEIGEN